MPASDRTFHSLKRMHAVFAVSALGLLAVTVWMIAADHYRPWKQYQRTYRDRIEPWLTAARIEATQTDEFLATREKLVAALAEARNGVPDRALIDRFCRAARQAAEARGGEDVDLSGVETAYQALTNRADAERRKTLLARLDAVVQDAESRQLDLADRLRQARADLDEARSRLEIAVGQGRPAEAIAGMQAEVDRLRETAESIALEADRAEQHVERLRGILLEITAEEEAAQAALAGHEAELERLRDALARQRPNAAKRVLEQPLIDAFGRPIDVEQIWLPELTIDYHFRRVARFDRCVTCHQGIARPDPQSPERAAIAQQSSLTLPMPRPETGQGRAGEEDEESRPSLEEAYGFALAPRGMLDPEAPTVFRVLPLTSAAHAGLEVGDVIEAIDAQPVGSAAEVEAALIGNRESDSAEPISLSVRRGLPPPYSGHPRLDLFVGATSPHPEAEYGCTICHGGQGLATDFTWASHTPNTAGQRGDWKKRYGWFFNHDWEYPMLPARFAESRCLKCHHAVTDLNPTERFPDPPAPKLLAGYHLIRQNGCFGCHEINGYDASGRRVGPDMRLEPGSGEDPPHPGTMRKVGPSLRDVAAKTDAAFLADWTEDPRRFLPRTRMPQFFGLHHYLEGRALAHAKRLETVEILGMTEYLLGASEPIEPLPPPAGVTEPPSPGRGKRLFLLHGCLACHMHADFPKGQATQGPDLTRMGAKYRAPSGRQWLESWIRDPGHLSPRTVMPSPLLEPAPLRTEGDRKDEASGGESPPARLSDPAADIAAYLLEANDWQPAPLPGLVEADLDELALLYLGRAYPRPLAEEYLREGIPESMAGEVRGEAVELLGPMTPQKKLRYVGRRTLVRRGCAGCHDIPGLEQAQPIGPALFDWGKKEESLLAFEQVHAYVTTGEAWERLRAERDWGFYLDAMRGHRREGFAWQKLRGPRSFDYQKAQNKPYSEWLLMGRFQLAPQEREAIITFLLGLVADPPAEKYVYQPDGRQRAIIEGQKVLDRFACAECHTLAMHRWTFQYDPDDVDLPRAPDDFEFLAPQFSAEEVARSMEVDRRGLGRAPVVGMPQRDARGEILVVEGDEEDDQGDPLPMQSFVLWEPAVIHGDVCWVGGADLLLYQRQVLQKRPPVGGALARLLYPVVLAEARAAGAMVSGMEPWGWVPPPLVGEGRKVRPDWLHRYLLHPTVIRPASVLRMPRYQMSSEEAAALAGYLAAADGAEFPYAARSRAREDKLPVVPERLDAAMRLLIDRTTFCAKCHRIGDYSPGEEVRTTLAPDLQEVGERLRPEYVFRWLAHPKRILPYTGMPVNFPPDGDPVGQDLLPGASLEQIEVVTRLLVNYDEYLRRRAPIRAMIEPTKGP